MENKYLFKTVIKILIPHLKKYTLPLISFFITATISTLIINSIDLSIPFFSKYFIDEGLVAKNFNIAVKFTFIIVLVTFINQFFRSVWIYLYNILCGRLTINVEKDLFHHILKLPLSYHDNVRTGEILKRIGDSLSLLNIINIIIFTILNNLVLLTINLIACFIINPVLSLLLLAFIPISLVINYFQGLNSGKEEELKFDQERVFNSELTESVFGLRAIKAHNLETPVFRKYKFLRLNLMSLDFKFKRIYLLLGWIGNFFGSIQNFVIYLAGAYFVIKNKITLGEWFAFTVIMGRVLGPVYELFNINAKMQREIVVLNRYDEITKVKEEEHKQNKDIEIKSGEITFNNVSFHYNSDNKVLSGININVKQGQRLALIGRSGVGKTTIANLILGFYYPTHGNILIDGVDIREYNVNNLRKNIGMVLQDTYLFNGTIMDNLKLCSSTKDEDKIIEACKISCVDDFVRDLQDGYNTHIGEKGLKLSGGQKQRIAIAQAILKDPKILILDEATSHLDIETETKVQKAFQYLMNKSTSIIIAHRLSTIKHADVIAVLENGSIIETGNHEELIHKDSFYKLLYTKYSTI